MRVMTYTKREKTFEILGRVITLKSSCSDFPTVIVSTALYIFFIISLQLKCLVPRAMQCKLKYMTMLEACRVYVFISSIDIP